MQPKPYLKGIFTCFSLSSNAFSSSDARTIPLSVWFSCKGVGNALNGKILKPPKIKSINRRRVCINRQTHLLNNFYSGYQWDVFKCFHARGAAFSLATLSVLTAKKTQQKNHCVHYPQLGCKQHNDIRILLSLFREVHPFVKTYYANFKISIY